MPERNPMTAIGDTITVEISTEMNGTVAASLTGGASPVGATAVVEIAHDDIPTWEIATLTRPDRSTVTSLSTGQSGYAEAPGYRHARLRLTALTSGTQGGRIGWRKG